MKGSIILAAAAAAGASAAAHGHAQAHAYFRRGADVGEVCVPGCKTIYKTIYGEPTLIPNPPSVKSSSAPAPVEPTPEPVPETTAEPTPTSTFTPPGDVPTPVPEVCPTPGEYTFPATTITVVETTTVCAPETTKLPPGTQTYGGVTTVVEKETTIVCPYPTAKTNDGVVTSVIETTTYVCPSAGTYTIAPTTTVCAEETTAVYPTITTIVPGTYTRPAVTTTITETNVVVVCPWTSKAPEPTKAPEPAPAPEPVEPETPTYEVPEAPKSEEPAKETPETPKASDVKLGGDKGDHWAITYTPYSQDASGTCKSAGEVDSDIQTIKNSGFTTVRIYSTDCDTLENVGSACKKYGMKLIIGVFVKDTCDPNSKDIKDQIDAITAWKQWDMVELVVVGNEALFQGRCDVGSLKNLITTVKGSCNGAGYTGPYTTAETLGVWEREDVSSALCGVVDIVGGQIHPYFNADVSPSSAGSFVKNQLEILDGICTGKTALNLECGWPTGGNANGKAVPGKSEQAEAIKSIRETCGDRTVFFSFHNDEWKDPGSCGCEQTWGCGQLF